MCSGLVIGVEQCDEVVKQQSKCPRRLISMEASGFFLFLYFSLRSYRLHDAVLFSVSRKAARGQNE